MGLGLALNNALSGLNVNQQALSTLANNIANANTPDYARRVINLSSQNILGIGAGVKIESVARQIDEFLVATVRQQGSTVGSTGSINDYYSRIAILLGSPNSDTSLSSVVDAFFSSLESLSVNPELSSIQLNAVNSAEHLANTIGGLAQSLEDLRYQADQDINATVNLINQKLDALRDLNINIRAGRNSGIPTADLEEKQEVLLRELAENINISYYKNDNGEIVVTTAGGVGLLGENRVQLDYTPAGSTETFINNFNLGAITVQTFRQNGTKFKDDDVLISSGSEDSIVSSLTGGKLDGLQKIRDDIIPNIRSQLDNLATALVEKINAIHNDGAGFPPPTSLIGTTAVALTDERQFSGSVRIALVNPDGTPLPDAYGQGDSLRPLTLDLASLDDGDGDSNVSIQTIIDEINNYYGPPQPRAELGPLADIKLVSRTDTLGPQAGFPANSTFTFDFELDNSSSSDLSFEVLNVQVPEAGATGLTSALPGAFSLSGGERTRTGAANAVTVDFNGVAANGPYTVRATVKVTDSHGVSFLTTIDYEVPNNVTGAFNDRVNPSSVFSGDGNIISPLSSQRYLTAELVDEKGNPAAPGTAGYLRLRSNTGAGDYRIAIDELDSQDLGQPTNSSAVPATNRGFSHFFGLNNLFVDNTVSTLAGSSQPAVDGSALRLAIRPDILKNPNLLSLGELTQSPLNEPITKTVTVGTVAASRSIQFLGAPIAGDSITVNGNVFTYVAGPTVNPNEIQVGGSLAQTLLNTVVVLNSNNTYTQGNTALATYVFDGVDTITATYDTPGVEGNAFQLAVDLTTSGQNAVFNGGVASQTASGVLQGGEDGTATITSTQLYTYELSSGANQVIKRLADLGLTNITFNAAGGLPKSSYTLGGYGAEIIAFVSTQASNSDAVYEQAKTLREGFQAKLESGSGVNLDEELANTILFQNAYAASAQVIKVTGELFDILFDTF